MRYLAIAAAFAAAPALSYASTSDADATIRQRHNDFYYRSYDTAYEPVCVVRKTRTTDEDGNPVVRTVRICR